MKHGIYRIRNIVNDKCYIGSAAGKGFNNRWNLHLNQLHDEKHHSAYLQRAWSKYNESSFVFEILLYCDPKNCLMYEQVYLDVYQPEYNICKVAGSSLGRSCSDTTKNKISQANKGKLSGDKNPMYGKTHSKDVKQKLSQIHKGKTISESQREAVRKHAIGNSYAKGKHWELQESTKCKMSKAKTGSNNPSVKLNERDVIQIRQDLLNGLKQKDVACRYNVSISLISAIKLGKIWKCISKSSN
jgi:group I intron endonuclease